MAKHVVLNGRHYWILSEPHGPAWKAHIVEMQADGTGDEIGIEATGETRGAADDSAERKLRRLVQVQP